MRVKKFDQGVFIRITTADRMKLEQLSKKIDLSLGEISRRSLRIGIKELQRNKFPGTPEQQPQ